MVFLESPSAIEIANTVQDRSNDMSDNKHLVFVYGILKNKGKLIHKDYAINGTMYDLGSFPAITALHTGNLIFGNIIEVDDAELAKFDVIEGHPFIYKRETVETNYGPAHIYIYQGIVINKPKINKWEDNVINIFSKGTTIKPKPKISAKLGTFKDVMQKNKEHEIRMRKQRQQQNKSA
jgi:gamma-glutamylcyclotransferase (GGCT)/AIG2-like uncharacterized protein YtfP